MISKEEVQNLATLARLELSEAEMQNLQKDISNILDYVGQVSAVGVNNVADLKPLMRNVMRDDKPYGEGGTMVLASREALLAALPKREDDYNVVRKIIQKDE